MMNTWLIRRAGAQAGLAGRHRAHQLVGVQAALHQQLAFGLVDELDRLGRGRLAVRRIDDLESVDLEIVLAGDGVDLRWPARPGSAR